MTRSRGKSSTLIPLWFNYYYRSWVLSGGLVSKYKMRPKNGKRLASVTDFWGYSLLPTLLFKSSSISQPWKNQKYKQSVTKEKVKRSENRISLKVESLSASPPNSGRAATAQYKV